MKYKLIGSMNPIQVTMDNLPTTGYSIGVIPAGGTNTGFLGEVGHT